MEAERIAELVDLGQLDTAADAEIDVLTRVAADICGTPYAMVSLIDGERQWFKSRVGVPVSEMPRSQSFCSLAIAQSEPVFIIPDTLPEYADNPYVRGHGNIRFYAGAPLVTSAGHAVGTLCVIDVVPHRLDRVQADALRATARAVTALLEQQRAIRRLEDARLRELETQQRLRLLESVVVHAHDAAIIVDAPRAPGEPPIIAYVNAAFTRLYGYEADEVVGLSPTVLFHEQTDWKRLAAVRVRVDAGESVILDVVLRAKDGSPVSTEMSMAQVPGEDGAPSKQWISLHRDVGAIRAAESARMRAVSVEESNAELQREIDRRTAVERELTFAAFHDRLTELPNRALFMDAIGLELERMQRGETRGHVAVFFVDLDAFKRVNDTHGHVAGDALLAAAGARLQGALRAHDLLARLGGDEFTVLVREVDGMHDVDAIAERLVRSMDAPFRVGGTDLFITASVGVVVVDAQYRAADDVLRDADIAMYHAKERGRNGYRLFHRSLRERIVAASELDDAMRGALAHGEFALAYQPIVDLTGDAERLMGFEALVRWDRPGLGRAYPGTFIPAAEESGLIIKLGEWVLRTGCRQLRAWHDDVPGAAGLKLSVNLSAKQLAHAGLVTMVRRTLHDTRVDGRFLVLEITESAIMDDVDSAMQVINELRTLGVCVHLDDFGMGYSSLNYLRRFAVNRLKIDRTFVSGADGRLADPAIVDTIVSLAHRLRLHAVAEGVETREQLHALRLLGCDAAQGALFGLAGDADEAVAYMRAHGPFGDQIAPETRLTA